MDRIGKIFKSVFWAVVVLGPLVYLGARTLPMITGAFDQADRNRAHAEAKRRRHLEAIAGAAEVASQAGAGDLAAVSASTQLANDLSTDDSTSSDHSVAGANASASSKTQTIEINNDNINNFWDPQAEERIKNMAITDELKNQILDNYRRTGVLPDALATNRQPASVQ